MLQNHNTDKKITHLLLIAFLMSAVFIITPPSMAESGKKNMPHTENTVSPPVTGRIDRIGASDIVINDTWFRLSENVSLSSFDKGDLVTFIADSNHMLLKIDRAKKNHKE